MGSNFRIDSFKENYGAAMSSLFWETRKILFTICDKNNSLLAKHIYMNNPCLQELNPETFVT